MRIKGFIHIHSNWSDGELSLLDIKKKAQKMGMSFVLLSDHSSWIGSQEKLDEFKRECKRLSNEKFLMIPGFEVESREGYHILIYNGDIFIEDGVEYNDIFNIFSNRKDVFLVLAHASQLLEKPDIDFLKKIDAVEVWNAKYDSKFAPCLRVLNWIKNKDIIPIAGTDAHSLFTLTKLWIEIEIESLEIKEIINSLLYNQFKISNGLISINLKENFNLPLLAYWRIVNLFYPASRKFFVSLVRKGLKPPKFLEKFFHKVY